MKAVANGVFLAVRTDHSSPVEWRKILEVMSFLYLGFFNTSAIAAIPLYFDKSKWRSFIRRCISAQSM